MTREEEITDLQRKIEAIKRYQRERERVRDMGLDPDLGPDLAARDPALPLACGESSKGTGWQEPQPLRPVPHTDLMDRIVERFEPMPKR
jgi:hypothetical protein